MEQRVITTARLTLVPLGDEHLEDEVTLDSDPAVMRYLGTGLPRTRDVVLQQHARRLGSARDGLGFWMGFADADADGDAGPAVGWWLLKPAQHGDERGQAELGYRLLPRYWRQGLASEGAAALLDHGFGELGLEKVFAETMSVNLGSQAVMKHLGMTYLRTRPVDPDDEVIPGSEHGEVDYTITRDAWLGRPRR
ncbi:hypothetical protein AX769_13560 [Frondihabitans sp. PAMC 28766]|uniref:GNAT family N-acetyltransferase n=1 Tax=Frondihabitans sp. PAMC 28766 TaxID=1795630 RepID=UPI00078DBC59|nr:GNAT family N-acetyltransferase [Frondihabitans sp. PAMC 28766]AMM20972.1 hypothetical protein AX769_13560 [Frondihabitans sp. PAMC 28766]